MHTVAAGVAFAALILYAHRSGWLVIHGNQSVWALVTRAGLAGLLGSIVIAFLDLAVQGAPFEWRHWLVFVACTLTAAGHVGLLRGGASNPT